MKRHKYTDDDIINAVISNLSIAGVARELGLVPIGGNYKTIKNHIKRLNLDVSHMTGQGWNTGDAYKKCFKGIPLEEILVEDRSCSSNNLKKRLISAGVKSYICEICGLSEWNNQPISLELDHINGISHDNRIENLRIVCPNCHAQTPTYRGKNIKLYGGVAELAHAGDLKSLSKERNLDAGSTPVAPTCECGKEMARRSKCCNVCRGKQQEKIIWPSNKELLQLLETTNYSALGKKLGVSDNAIRKRLNK